MSPDAPQPSPSPSLAAPTDASALGGAADVNRPGPWPVRLALGLALLAVVMSGLLWQRQSLRLQELARRHQDSLAQATEARALAAQAGALTQELQARLAVAEIKLSEVSLQRSQLEELMLTLSRSRDDTLVQDIESALRLAQQQSQLTGSTQPLISALQAADQRIARAAQPRLNPVQRAMTRDVERIRNASVTDVPALVSRLDELSRQVDGWPVANEVGPRASIGRTSPPTAQASSITDPASEVLPTDPSWSERLQTFWGRVWRDVTQRGRELVRVSRIDRPEAVLLAPEQAFFLRENLKLKLLNARLGLLARQMGSAQADVAAVETALSRHFDMGVSATQAARAELAQLREQLQVSELPRPDESLAALAAAAGGR